ncbi:unnamed protein product [Notodromas monacha]|uniref:Tetraspanin n=1 Tax=Notodromas monacha TaxID=399045 RepID=A0A7R9BIF3_9CRUS|nr:unnamed protein product [Notodromas monacha]CAG0915222.1 unnamed protein product [Notodromas monacha]
MGSHGKPATESRYSSSLGDPYGCDNFVSEANQPPLEPYGDNNDPFAIKARMEAMKNRPRPGTGDDQAEYQPLCEPIEDMEDFPMESGTQKCLVSSITKHESVIAAARSLALVLMTLIAICACAVLAAGVVCLMQYRFNLSLSVVEIMVAIALFIIAGCGFYSAWSEQPTYLWWSVASMTILTAAVLSVGVGMITSRHKLESEGFEQDFKARARLAYVDGSETNRAYIDAIQETLQCCGAK